MGTWDGAVTDAEVEGGDPTLSLLPVRLSVLVSLLPVLGARHTADRRPARRWDSTRAQVPWRVDSCVTRPEC